MDPVANPYAPGAGTPPPYLAGREELSDAFATMLGRASRGNAVQPIVLTGLRGVGKTVLLLEWRRIATDANWATAHLEARGEVDLRPQIVDALIDLLRQTSRNWRSTERIERLKRIATSFARAAGATATRGGFTFGVEPEPGVADSGSLETDLAELLIELGRAAREEGSGAVLLIDELQDADPAALAGLVGAIHRVNQERLPALVVGAGLPTTSKVLSEAKSYAERLFDVRHLGVLDDVSQDLAITEPASHLGVVVEPDALAVLRQLAGGYPFFIQTYAKHAWDAAVASPIVAEDVRVAAPRAMEQLRRSFFTPRVERATAGERRYLVALAGLGGEEATTGEVAAALGRSRQSVAMQRDALIAKGLIYAPERGTVAFTVPHMGSYLRALPIDPTDDD
jgi:hypothetical protein